MEKEGTITLLGKNNDSITLKSMYHVSGMKKNLFSMANVVDVGYYVLFGLKAMKFLCNIKNLNVDVINTGKRIKDLFFLLASIYYIDKMSSNDRASIWHKGFGHINMDKLIAIVTCFPIPLVLMVEKFEKVANMKNLIDALLINLSQDVRFL